MEAKHDGSVSENVRITVSSRRIEKAQIMLAKIFPWDTQLKACSAPHRLISLACCEQLEAVFIKETHPSDITSGCDGTRQGWISQDSQCCIQLCGLCSDRRLR